MRDADLLDRCDDTARAPTGVDSTPERNSMVLVTVFMVSVVLGLAVWIVGLRSLVLWLTRAS